MTFPGTATEASPALADRQPVTGPFTPSRFKGLPQDGGAVTVERADVWAALRQARVTAPVIPEGRPLPRAALAPALAAVADPAPVAEADVILRLEPPRAQRPVSRRSGLRLLPLDGFVWGSHSTPPQPRTRTDHVLLWVTAGALRLDLPGRRTLMGPGTVHYLPAGTGFATLPLGGARGMVLLLSADLARGAAPALPEAPVSGSIGAAAPSLLAALTDLAREAAQGNDAQSRAAVACHLGLLALRLARLDPPPARPLSATPAAPDLPLVDRFLALAAANLGSGRTVGELAESLGVTTPVLDRACRGARGRRAIELIHDLRHETAVRLLRTTALPLAEIARELGFSSHAHFTRAFVSRTGRLPEAFRHG